MTKLNLRVVNKNGDVLSESSGDEHVYLLFSDEYAEGDRIELSLSENNQHIVWQVDDALGAAMCYVSDGFVAYEIPFGQMKRVYSPKTFSGNKHYIYARIAEKSEVVRYRNLALNVADQHDVVGCYPHASANVEMRGESVFAARNAIDGVYANHNHGKWPHESWGINRDPNAEMKLDFGRDVLINCIRIFLRADFPHDSYWTEGTVEFSDGSREILKFVKTDKGQSFSITERKIRWLKLGKLIKANDDSPFPALTQIEVYGKDIDI